MPGITLDPSLEAALRARAAAIPIFDSLSFEMRQLGEGRCVLSMPRRREHDGVFESLHGGLLMTLADSAACFAILTMIGADAALTTTDMNIRFLAPCLSDATADARVIRLGTTLAPVAVDLRDARGTLVAVAQVAYFRLNRRPIR
jgi:uncharacterized protein (TIGR00369 family)